MTILQLPTESIALKNHKHNLIIFLQIELKRSFFSLLLEDLVVCCSTRDLINQAMDYDEGWLSSLSPY